jgi:hypothetical protein
MATVEAAGEMGEEEGQDVSSCSEFGWVRLSCEGGRMPSKTNFVATGANDWRWYQTQDAPNENLWTSDDLR